MNPTYYIPILLLLFIVLIKQQRERQIVQKQIIKKRKGGKAMIELAKRMIGKECLVYTFNGTQLTGTVTEIDENAILLDNGKEQEIVNLDFVIRIREYPRKKDGKKKSVVLD
ncbi:MAG: RNA chaperone Hfq [Clostridia bacterium]|nr:RNA chaperone Hfq [Clostridia bacterium]